MPFGFKQNCILMIKLNNDIKLNNIEKIMTLSLKGLLSLLFTM